MKKQPSSNKSSRGSGDHPVPLVTPSHPPAEQPIGNLLPKQTTGLELARLAAVLYPDECRGDTQSIEAALAGAVRLLTTSQDFLVRIKRLTKPQLAFMLPDSETAMALMNDVSEGYQTAQAARYQAQKLRLYEDTIEPGNDAVCSYLGGVLPRTVKGYLKSLILWRAEHNGLSSSHGEQTFIDFWERSTADEHAARLWHLSEFAPLALVVHSGGKSLHGWFPVGDAPPADVEKFMRYATRIGADKKLFTNPSQFVRLPEGRRENGKRQAVYYWNPAATMNVTNGEEVTRV